METQLAGLPAGRDGSAMAASGQIEPAPRALGDVAWHRDDWRPLLAALAKREPAGGESSNAQAALQEDGAARSAAQGEWDRAADQIALEQLFAPRGGGLRGKL